MGNFLRRVKRFSFALQAIRRNYEGRNGFFRFAEKIGAILRSEGPLGVYRRFRRLSSRGTYPEWIGKYDRMSPEIRLDALCRISAMATKPLISVIMPTFNPDPKWLEQAIESVRNQTYTEWQLCIADDASTDPKVKLVLEKYRDLDSRVLVFYRQNNGHISAATNTALSLATGSWVAFLDHDDLLAENALYWVAQEINDYPNAKLIYSDEDKINEKGKRYQPYFKPDWNKHLFYSHNLITHLAVYRRSIVSKIGGFRLGFEGAQDYDLALRYIEAIEGEGIRHIPRILYHWRVHSGSTAQTSAAKPYAMMAGEKALNDHFHRLGISTKAQLQGHGYRLHYTVPASQPLVSIIIPTRNAVELVKQCVESIFKKTTYKNYEIILVDNNSDDAAAVDYFGKLGLLDKVRVVKDARPFNFSALNNAAAKHANGDFLALLNNDIEVITPEWLTEMVSIALQPDVGAVGAKLLYPNDTLQHAGIILLGDLIAGHAHKGLPRHSPGYAGRASLVQSFSAVTGACLVVSKKKFNQVGGLNEEDLKVAFNDVDFCLRLQEAGYKNVWTPHAKLYHHESATRGYEDTPEKKARFASEAAYMKTRWRDILWNDPSYNPNLTLDYEDFSLAFPPRVQVLGGTPE